MDRLYRTDFFKDKKPKNIKKEFPVEVRIPKEFTIEQLLEKTETLEYDEHLKIPEDKIIPQDWISYYKNKFPGKKIEQNELVNHGEICLIKLGGHPLDVIKHYLKNLEKPYVSFGWVGGDGIIRRFRVPSIFEAWNQYKDLEILGEEIKTSGCKREISCSVPSRSQRDVIEYGFPKISIPIEKGAGFQWMDTVPHCHCKYNQNGAIIHYMFEWCLHPIEASWEAKKNNLISYDIFPKPTEYGEEFYRRLKDQTIIGNRNLTFTEKDIIIQEKIIRTDPEKLLDFSY